MEEKETQASESETRNAVEFQPAPPSNRGFAGEIWDFLRVRKKFWLAPIILALAFLGLLFMLANSAGFVSPFIYAL